VGQDLQTLSREESSKSRLEEAISRGHILADFAAIFLTRQLVGCYE